MTCMLEPSPLTIQACPDVGEPPQGLEVQYSLPQPWFSLRAKKGSHGQLQPYNSPQALWLQRHSGDTDPRKDSPTT